MKLIHGLAHRFLPITSQVFCLPIQSVCVFRSCLFTFNCDCLMHYTRIIRTCLNIPISLDPVVQMYFSFSLRCDGPVKHHIVLNCNAEMEMKA